MPVSTIFLLLLLTISADKSITVDSKFCSNITVTEYELYEQLMRQQPSKEYAWLRPVENARKPVNIGVRLVLSGINDVVEREGVVKLTFYLSLQWHDPFKVWNHSRPFACLESIVVPPKGHFIPDIALINSRRHYEMILSDNVEKLRFYSNGTVTYRPGGTFDIFCKFDLRWFPYDDQSCTLKLESWRHTVKYQTLSFMDPPFGIKYFLENDQWHLTSIRHRKIITQYVTDAQFDHIEFELKIRRKLGYYLMNVIFPSVIISVAQFAVFAIPIGEVMKIHISFTCLLAYGTCLLMVMEDLPRSSDRIPLLSIYITISMGNICLAILGEGLVFACLRAEKGAKRRIPAKIYSLVEFWATIFGVEKANIGHYYRVGNNLSTNSSSTYLNSRRTSRYRQNNGQSISGNHAALSMSSSFRQQQQKLLPTLEEESAIEMTGENFNTGITPDGSDDSVFIGAGTGSQNGSFKMIAESRPMPQQKPVPTFRSEKTFSRDSATLRKSLQYSLSDSAKAALINEPRPDQFFDTEVRRHSGGGENRNSFKVAEIMNAPRRRNFNGGCDENDDVVRAAGETLRRLNKKKWHTVASVIECLTLAFYTLCTIFTPICMFAIAPLIARREASAA